MQISQNSDQHSLGIQKINNFLLICEVYFAFGGSNRAIKSSFLEKYFQPFQFSSQSIFVYLLSLCFIQLFICPNSIIMKSIFIVGASGSGKTTLAKHLQQLYSRFFGGQAVITVNLDCANPFIEADVDVCNLVTLEDVMEEYELGPNGALLFATDFLLTNIQWLYQQIQKCAIQRDPSFRLSQQMKLQLKERDSCQLTLIFDLPGQMQLYLQSGSMQKVISQLADNFGMKACLVQVFDASYIYEINDFVSMCMTTLTTGINFNMPHISLLNKIDLLKNRKPAGGMLEDYFKVASLRQMVNDLRFDEAPLLQSLEKVVDQYGRVSFAPGSVQIEDLTLFLIFHLQKIFGTLQINIYANVLFGKAIKPFLKDFSTERLINNLEAELFQEEQFDVEAELAAMKAKFGKE